MSNSAQRDAKDTRDESSRAGDTDRIQLAQLLAYAAEQGRLQLKDYEDRLTRAYAATTYEELDQLSSDLPGAAVYPRRGGKLNPAPSMLLLALVVHLSVLNQAPASAYFADTLQAWEQGRFIRFNGLAQWLGWLWPYAVLAYVLLRVSRPDRTPTIKT